MSGNGRIASELTGIVGAPNCHVKGGVAGEIGGNGFLPRWAVFPEKREEVREVIDLCRRESLAIIPKGNGTKMESGGVPHRADLLLSTKKMNRVIDRDCENLSITVETGALFSDIQDRMHQEGIGYFIPLDPPFTEASTLGGILGANSSGPKRLLYGTARDLVLGMKVAMADGKIISCGGKTVKNVSGYDIGKLFIGSLGTLGIIIESTLRLLPLPEEEETYVASFSGAETAFEAVREILKSQLIPSSIEILNPRILQEIAPKPLTGGNDYLLVIGVEGVNEAVLRQIKDLHEICDRYHPKQTEVLKGNEQEGFWRAVRDSSLKLQTPFPQSVFIKIIVPISKTGQAFAFSEGAARQEGFLCALSSHAGSGIIQMALLFDQVGLLSDRVVQTVDRITQHAVELGGNLMVESAPVSLRRQMKVWGREGSDVPLSRQLKSELDPFSLFSPGKFVGGI